MGDRVILGTIVKAVGLKGEVKLLPSPDFWLDALKAEALDVLSEDTVLRTVHVARSRPKGQTYILKLDGIDTIEAAEPFIRSNLGLSLDALDVSTLPGELLPCQIIGLDVVLKDGAPFGVVVDMLLGAAQNCLIVEHAGERYLVPHVPDIVRKVSIEEGIVEIDPPEGLLDLRW
jgi:16S rRNA processing protein RimM